jgi:phosphoglycolate phosphatase-like HAD superfamily hydrolase
MRAADQTRALDVPSWVRGLIFDCDGTLADTMALHYAAWEETFAAQGLACPLEFLVRHNGKPTDRIVAQYNVEFNQNLDVERFTADKERRALVRLDQARPLEPVAALARRYHGVLPMAVVSGGTCANVERILRAIGLRDLFPVVLTADDGLPPNSNSHFGAFTGFGLRGSVLEAVQLGRDRRGFESHGYDPTRFEAAQHECD